MAIRILLILLFTYLEISWAQTLESSIHPSVFSDALKTLESGVSPTGELCTKDSQEESFFKQTLQYDCECEEPSKVQNKKEILPFQITSFSFSAGVGNDNHLFFMDNDDYGLTWYKEITADLAMKLKNDKALVLKYGSYGGQYTQRLSNKTFITTDGSKHYYKKDEEFRRIGNDPDKFEEFKYLYDESEGDTGVLLNNQKSLSKTQSELSAKYEASPQFFVTSAVGRVKVDGDSNQKLAEKQQSHHKAAKIYNFNYEDFGGQVEGFSENVSYIFTRAGLGKEFKGEFLNGKCTLRAVPEISLQRNIKIKDKDDIVSNWQPQAMMTVETGLFKTKNQNAEDRKKIEVASHLNYNPKEILPLNTDPGNAGSITTSVRLNFYSKAFNFSKNANTGYQVGFYLVPVSITKGFGDTKNVLPSRIDSDSKNEMTAKWAVGGIVITPFRTKK